MPVNAEQASKHSLREPTRCSRGRPLSDPGPDGERLGRLWSSGVMATACMQTENRRNTGNPSGGR